LSDPYLDFLKAKSQAGADSGFEPVWMPDFLFDYQRALCEWSIRKGRAALLADCGLGKTPMGLTWASNVARKTMRPVLYLTPHAVGAQTVAEAEKFGIEARLCRDGKVRRGDHIVVANYERLHHFDPSDFSGVLPDESSILKNFAGERRGQITEFSRRVPYRKLQTATAAPNDYLELGTSSEALGYLGHMDMLNRFFKNDANNSATGRNHGNTMKWRLKGHAEQPFWRWVCSWARALRRPSDLGFSDDRFVLPPLHEVEHLVDSKSVADGMLFALPAADLREQREERRRTLQERCQKVADLVNPTGKPALVWCHLNEEGDALERLIPDAVQVSGSDSDDSKEERLQAFAQNKVRVLITKPKIGAWGLNLQHCAHVVYFPTHSFEQYYQAVRRCWRFGQKQAVRVDIVTTEGERGVMQNLQRKAAQADEMFSRLVSEMNAALSIDRAQAATNKLEVPAWLCSTSA
jgi:superfamily II DNA or RNA helicase